MLHWQGSALHWQGSALHFAGVCVTICILAGMKDLEVERDAIVIENEDSITNYYKLRQQITKLEREMQQYITKPMFCVPFLQPGRLVRVEHNKEDFGWGSVINYQKKTNQKVRSGRGGGGTLGGAVFIEEDQPQVRWAGRQGALGVAVSSTTKRSICSQQV